MDTNPATKSPSSSLPATRHSEERRKRSRVGWLALLALVTVLLAAAWLWWQVWPVREPPEIELAGADPAIVSAVQACRRKVRTAPRSSVAWGELGKILAAHGYHEDATSCFAEAERLDPGEPRWPYLRGLNLMFSDGVQATAAFQAAVQLPGHLPAMRLRLADMLLAQGNLDGAEEQYRSFLDVEPSHPRAELGLAQVAYQRGDLATARSYLARTVNHPQTQKACHILLAEIALRAHDSPKAADERRRALDLPTDQDWIDPLVLEIEGLRVGQQARLERAVRTLGQQGPTAALPQLLDLVREYPDWDQVWLAYGRALLQSGDNKGAEKALQTALRLAPDSLNGHFFLGVTLFQSKDYQAASKSFRTAARLKPDYALAHFNLGHCLRRQGDRAGAMAAFDDALRAKPNYAQAHLVLAELLAESGDQLRAREHLRLAIDLDPADASARKLSEKLHQKK